MKINNLTNSFKGYLIIEKGLKPKTYRSSISSLNMLCDYLGTYDLKEMTTETIRDFMLKSSERRLWKPKTFINHRQQLKVFFDWCVKKNFITKNPVLDIEKPKLPKSLPRCISRDEIEKILYHVAWYKWKYDLEKERNTAILSTFIYTGIRRNELLNLEVVDINFTNNEIFIRSGKGGKDRIVPIHPALAPILKNYFYKRQDKLKPSKWFFTGIKSDKRLNEKNIAHICKKISVKSGVYFTPHMLRHTFAKLMVDNDYNIFKLKEILGHEQISTTQIYMSVAKEAIKSSFEKVKLI